MDASEVSSLIQTLNDLQTYHWASVAALAWLLYDMALAMDDEIKHIWQADWSPAKVLYISCRWLGIYTLLVDTVVGTNSGLPNAFCCAYPALIFIGIEGLAISINLIQILRGRALFQGNRMVLIPLWLLFFANTVISISLSVTVVSWVTVTPASTLFTIDGCLATVNHPELMLGPYISSTIYSGVFFLLTLAKLYPYFTVDSGETPMLTVFVRDGTLFFVVIFVVELVSVLWSQMITPIRPSLQDIVNVLRIAIYAISGPRLILHLRGVVMQPSYSTTRITQTDGMFELSTSQRLDQVSPQKC